MSRPSVCCPDQIVTEDANRFVCSKYGSPVYMANCLNCIRRGDAHKEAVEIPANGIGEECNCRSDA